MMLDSNYKKPVLIILSGPSGVGKDAVLNRLKQMDRDWYFVVTATTRVRRPSEIDGVDYFFLGKDKFLELHGQGMFLESAEVYGNWYGTPKASVFDALDRGQDVIIKVDIQGVSNINQTGLSVACIFLMPPSLGELERRLTIRQTETLSDLALRMENAVKEIDQMHLFDYVVINDDIDKAASDIKSIITAEQSRIRMP